MPRQLLDWNMVSFPPRATRIDNAPVRVETEHFAIDFETRTAWSARAGTLELTAMQWRLVEFFVQNPGRTLTHIQLLHAGWGFRDDAETDYVGIVVAQVRDKLEPEPRQPRYFVSVPDEGFRFVLNDGHAAWDVGTLAAPDPVELVIDAFANAIHPVQIEQRADLLRLLGDERAVPALLSRLCESRVNDDPDVEDAVCGALVKFGVMRRLGNRRFRMRPEGNLSPEARAAFVERRALIPARYWVE
jgi:DNA-binding winged helix-turn-helix (wHTH) protein